MFCQRTSNNHNIIHRTGNFETLDVLAEGIHTHSGSRTWGAGRTLRRILILFFICLILLRNVWRDFLSGWRQSYVKEKEMVFCNVRTFQTVTFGSELLLFLRFYGISKERKSIYLLIHTSADEVASYSIVAHYVVRQHCSALTKW